jgi:putative mRNA 3-end processing factor
VPDSDLLQLTPRGLYCSAGDFFVDPWEPVDRAVITHAHADHARAGSGAYLAARAGEAVLRLRLGPGAAIQTAAFGENIHLLRAKVSLHPAGHILGSAQVRIEVGGQVWVVSGDFKVEPDATCTPFEPVPCHTFVTESTFGLPIYRWPREADVFQDIRAWWQANRAENRASLLFAYALGKSQRLLAGLADTEGAIFTHGAVEKMTQAYRTAGIAFPQTTYVGVADKGQSWAGALVVAPPLAKGTPWVRRFGNAATGFLSGWMQVRGFRRRRAVDRGFVLSDHADWPGLLAAIRATGAQSIWVTHGYTDVLARWLREHGLDARTVTTRFKGEGDDALDEEAVEETAS